MIYGNDIHKHKLYTIRTKTFFLPSNYEHNDRNSKECKTPVKCQLINYLINFNPIVLFACMYVHVNPDVDRKRRQE